MFRHVFSRFYCSSITSFLDKRTKSAKIQSSIKLYLNKVKEHEILLETEREDFERGRKYLAQIVGEDPITFDQSKIDEAIKYLFPSGLFGLRARPKLKPPEEVFPKKKQLQCDSEGRPLHHLFYTRHPNFYNLMHEATYQLESIKNELDKFNTYKDTDRVSKIAKIILTGTEWLTRKQLEGAIDESIDESQYERWLLLMNRIADHPLAQLAHEFIFQYRSKSKSSQQDVDYPEPNFDTETQKHHIKAIGQKRRCFAEAEVWIPGSGKFEINGKSLLLTFPELGNREQLMFPLNLTGTLGAVDVIAKVTGEGTSSMANALRLAISRCLASLLPTESGKNKLRVSGLLTQDDRFAERKKPGQRKARKKPIW